MAEQTETCLAVYREDPSRVEQDANNELRISEGGYNNRQLEETVQNAVDAARHGGGRIELRLTTDTLYVANDGEPFSADGVNALLGSDLSRKEGDSIGRFGIGFKSVLAISDCPRVFSRSVSFGFDKAWAESTLRGYGFVSPRYPMMRIAQVLDPQVHAAADPHLKELMDWASTAVVLPLSAGYVGVSRRLMAFRPEFVLFASHIREARFHDLTTWAARGDGDVGHPEATDYVIRRISNGDSTVTIEVGDSSEVWSLAEAVHQPSARARAEAGRVADRTDVPVQYATRVPPTTGVGQFWAYFPTREFTTLSGLVNAPWKLSDDRLGILDTPFNEEILTSVLPRLVGEAVQVYGSTEDPVRILDALPARGRENRSWADETINEPVIQHMRTIPSVPDGTGRLRKPAELRWTGFVEEVERGWLQEWAEHPAAPKGRWVHSGAYSTQERRSKIERLMSGRAGRGVGGDGSTASSIAEWLEDLVADGSVTSSAAAIRLAARIAQDSQRIADSGRRSRAMQGVLGARLIRLEDGDFRKPEKGRVFVRQSETDAGHDFVDAALVEEPGVKDALGVLGIVVYDRSGELRGLFARARSPEVQNDKALLMQTWQRIWQTVRTIEDENKVYELFVEDFGAGLLGAVRIRTADGSWRGIADAYLEGRLVARGTGRDQDRLIDPAFHSDGDVRVLRRIGAVDEPRYRPSTPPEPWQGAYEAVAVDRFINAQKGSTPQRDRIVAEGSMPPWPLEPLIGMSAEARAVATESLLRRGMPTPWTVHHSTNSSYGRLNVPAPEVWFLARHGAFDVPGFGILPPGEVFQASESVDPEVFPTVDVSDPFADRLRLRTDPDDDGQMPSDAWKAHAARAESWTGSTAADARRGKLYGWLPFKLPDEPLPLVARIGARYQKVAPENIGVTTDPAVYESLIEAQVPALLLADDADCDKFVEEWDAKRGKDLLQEEVVTITAGEPEYLLDVYPPMKLFVPVTEHEVQIQPCRSIERLVATPEGQKGRPIPQRRDGAVVHVTATDPAQVLAQVSTALNLSMSATDIRKVFDGMARQKTTRLRAEVRKAKTDGDRLLVAVGVDVLRRSLPKQVLDIVEGLSGKAPPHEIAALACSVHGVGILRQPSILAALQENGLEPPREWTGRSMTRRWVEDLGFPTEWAGFQANARPAQEMIDGPAVLKPLHDYQVKVTERIKNLFLGTGSDRGMVALPTGAGKTRVAVQALVDGLRQGYIADDEPLVWIAQTEELCEQAVETWTHIWRAVGPETAMNVGRLWGSNSVVEDPSSFQLVVAGIDKLRSVSEREPEKYEWLRGPSVVIIDEAHTSVTSEYTKALEWLGRSGRTRKVSQRRPLIGLTATPFRGRSERETGRLVSRYGSNRLDTGAFADPDNPYLELQGMGVLARVRQQILDGVKVTLTSQEIADIEKAPKLPPSVTERLGDDNDRTLRIVDHIASQPEDWTMLVFASSVENSRTLAALLSRRGVPAVSISANTEAAARRHYVKQFRDGKIRVITNYGVLTQGFDAPKVQAVYVTRPTFSPNVYQQMIGRGLRGRLNGGSEEVTIVNVQDNFTQFGDLLAFNQFEYLWRR
ncbi:sacsin N-terminal ATP-binding-like domain-containing protein [Myceligenerans pegani]|uniref:DEAD/DEAH box helicase family protein n=1 Tax=Myceligenerans pegani TaxID=2776917 RepID=A0ABR9N1P7_9MICO|nr:DEAD/DEAH box helicase family protein [Myceligenerans sp. TRM 65318]MBE1877563.1 DEAD/DEAH box helicase family protein [Myceligenerans sp. TRM 65318]MBE3019834.1 DEAD/DEAH box helicase family protein [Myceligenerans sp. TRM 65318]